MITVEQIPQPEVIDYILAKADQTKFPSGYENELQFIIHYRSGPYLKYVYTEANDEAWLRFRPFTDGRFVLYLSYRQIEIYDNVAHKQIYSSHFVGYEREKRRWVVNKIIGLVENPSAVKDLARKVASQHKWQKMVVSTVVESIKTTLNTLGAELSSCSVQDDNTISLSFNHQGSCFGFRFPSNMAVEFIEDLPNIISDFIGLKKCKRGRVNYNLPYGDVKWIKA